MNANVIHRAVSGGPLGVIAFTNGNYIGLISLSVSPLYSVNYNAFTLPIGYVAKDIRVENDMYEILCDDSGTNPINGSRIRLVTWDGSSNPEPIDVTTIDDNLGLALENINGFPIMMTKGRGLGNALRKKDYWGWPQVQFLNTTNQGINDINPSSIATSSGQLVIVSQSNGFVYLYGSPFATYSYRGTDNTGTFPDALTTPFILTGTNGYALTIGSGLLFTLSQSVTGISPISYTPYGEVFPLSGYTVYNNPSAKFQTNFIPLPKKCMIDWIKFSVLPLTGVEAFTPQLFVDYGTSPITMQDGDLTSLNLDTNVNAKTYQNIGTYASNLAIGGLWSNSSANTSTVVISKIDIGLSIA